MRMRKQLQKTSTSEAAKRQKGACCLGGAGGVHKAAMRLASQVYLHRKRRNRHFAAQACRASHAPNNAAASPERRAPCPAYQPSPSARARRAVRPSPPWQRLLRIRAWLRRGVRALALGSVVACHRAPRSRCGVPFEFFNVVSQLPLRVSAPHQGRPSAPASGCERRAAPRVSSSRAATALRRLSAPCGEQRRRRPRTPAPLRA